MLRRSSSGGTAVVRQRGTMFTGQRQDFLNAADRHHALFQVHALAEGADVWSGCFATGLQAKRGGQRVTGRILVVSE